MKQKKNQEKDKKIKRMSFFSLLFFYQNNTIFIFN